MMKKTLVKMIAVLTLVIAFILPAASNTYAAENDYRKWKTNDSRWGSVLLGNTQGAKTIGNAGCAITSYTKMLIQGGIKDSSFTPDKANAWAKNNGLFYGKYDKDSKGKYCGACIKSWSGLDKIDSRITYNTSVSKPSQATLLGYINDKEADYDYGMILECSYGSHYVTVNIAASRKSGKVVLMDCANRNYYSDGKTPYDNANVAFGHYNITKAYIYRIRVNKTQTTATAPKTTTTAPRTSTMALSNNLNPSTIMAKGGCFTVAGKITSNTNIKSVTVTVKTILGTVKFSKTVNVNAKSYSLYGVDGAMKFSGLPAGAYFYEVKAQDQLTTKTWRTTFVVKAANISVSKYTCPSGTLKKGNTFSIKGIVKSGVNIKKVTLSVSKTDGTKMFSASANVNAKSYDLHKLDAKMTFRKLPAGAYVYRAAVEDANGTVKYVLTRSFTVK